MEQMNALFLTQKLLSVAMFLAGIEFLSLAKNKCFLQIWSFENLQSDLARGLPLPNYFLKIVFSEKFFLLIAGLQTFISALAFVWPSWGLFAILFLTHLYFCIRFRGTYNGGSDMMTFVVLTGVLIASWDLQSLQLPKYGLIYIVVHTTYSYFKAGLVKVVHVDWRTGEALPVFLSRSLFVDTKKISIWLKRRQKICFCLSWFVLTAELLSPFFILSSHWIPVAFLFAMIFHLVNYFAFGLNRFVWIWLSAWPALFYLI